VTWLRDMLGCWAWLLLYKEKESGWTAGRAGSQGLWLRCLTERRREATGRKRRRRWLVDFEGSIPCKNKGKEMEACKGRRREHEGQLKDYILSSFHYIFWLQDRTIYRLIKGSTSHKTLVSTPDDMGLDYAARIKEVGCCRLL
jgi:hypothetical protein